MFSHLEDSFDVEDWLGSLDIEKIEGVANRDQEDITIPTLDVDVEEGDDDIGIKKQKDLQYT